MASHNDEDFPLEAFPALLPLADITLSRPNLRLIPEKRSAKPATAAQGTSEPLFPELFPLADMTLPPEEKRRVAEPDDAPIPQPVPAAAPPEQDAPGQEQPFVVIEQMFPRIAESIHLMWGHMELENYLQGLIMTDRADRAGFPPHINAALLKLYNQHVTLFKFERTADNWSHDPTLKHTLKADRKSPR